MVGMVESETGSGVFLWGVGRWLATGPRWRRGLEEMEATRNERYCATLGMYLV